MARDYVLQTFQSPVNPQIDYAKELNPQQLAAVTALPGPALVIAGAGSGKTRTLTYRVAYLLEQGIPPDRILLLTFTNKAAKEMMRRVADLLGTELRSLAGGTFHSMGARLIRDNADLLGFRRDFTILDREDSRDLVKTCLADPFFEQGGIVMPKPDVLVSLFSIAVNKYTSIEEAIAQEHGQLTGLTSQIVELGKRFKERKKASNVMDFDDLLTGWLQLLEEHPAVLERYQRQFQFILVDEYQDTNTVQGKIIDLLGARHQNVMVVGDDSQSIYSWRGANFRNIIDFPKRYPKAAIYKIETNYRSTPEILNLANAAIAANIHQFKKELTADKKSGMKPVLVPCSDANIQAAFICQRIQELNDEGVSMSEVAILYRAHFHAMELQLELARRHIPFVITSGVRFFEQAHIKDLTSFLKLMANPTDELSFKRIAQLLPGIGAKAAEKLWTTFRSKSEGLPSPAPTTSSEPSAPETSTPTKHALAKALQQCQPAVPKKAILSWTEIVTIFAQMESLHDKPSELIQLIIEAFYQDYLEDSFDNHRQRLEDVQQLGVFAHQFQDLENFLTQLSLLTEIEPDEETKKTDDSDKVRLTTIHQAKGLEYDVVFSIMLCEGLFPSTWSLESVDGEEEERRLFYVAITRARKELYLSYPLMRYTQAYGETRQLPSRFISELPPELYEEWNLRQTAFGY
ncbi:MAG: UvrD-helicase domain-containing protein [Verrucomicrobiales bacterium]|nr:UvrD-helicase domain-containing protein [Verrucomicrobiales bacterium]